MTALPASLDFEGVPISIIDRNGRPWVTGLQIASAIGFKNPRADVANLFRRNRDEFTPDMTAVISHGRTRVRIFSARGCHLLGMFARTARAKAFRRWVLDILEGCDETHRRGQLQPQVPAQDDKAFRRRVLDVLEDVERQRATEALYDEAWRRSDARAAAAAVTADDRARAHAASLQSARLTRIVSDLCRALDNLREVVWGENTLERDPFGAGIRVTNARWLLCQAVLQLGEQGR